MEASRSCLQPPRQDASQPLPGSIWITCAGRTEEEESVWSTMTLCSKSWVQNPVEIHSNASSRGKGTSARHDSAEFYKSTIVLSWLGLTWSDQAEAGEVGPWRYVSFPRESSGKVQGQSAGLAGPDSRLSSAGGKVLYFS